MNTSGRKKLPGIYWLAVAFCALAVAGIYFAARDKGIELREARRLVMARGQQREAEHYCAAWRSDTQEFTLCGAALRAYRHCDSAWLSEREQNGAAGAEGVYCEHPKYQFHEQEQNEVQDAMRAPAPGR